MFSTDREESPGPPSHRPGIPLLSSYTYSSSKPLEDPTEGDSEQERAAKETQRATRQDQEWMMGIDEAGRGPVLGPLVYGVAFCSAAFSGALDTFGFADSKTLTHERRVQLLKMLQSRPGELEWSVRVISPADISAGMLRKTPYNLNAQSFDATCDLIRHALKHHYNIRSIFVDTVGPPAAYSAKLSAAFPGIEFTVCSKADSIYPIVGAASVAAKVSRDAVIQGWVYPEVEAEAGRKRKREGGGVTEWSRAMGSGYPSDPNTIHWLDQHFDPVFGYPSIARFSWGTIKERLDKSGGEGKKVKWTDEPASIQKWFTDDGVPGSKLKGVWKEMGMKSVAAL